MGLGDAFDNTAPGVRAIDSRFIEKKKDVRALATTNTVIASTGNGATVGGVVVATGDRVALTGQTAGAENGIYTVGASSLTRSSDANSADLFTLGFKFKVTEGTHQTEIWHMTTTAAITLDTTALAFANTNTGPTGIDLSGTWGAFSNTPPVAHAV